MKTFSVFGPKIYTFNFNIRTYKYLKARLLEAKQHTFFSKKAFLNPYYISLSPQMAFLEEEELPTQSIKSNPIKAQ